MERVQSAPNLEDLTLDKTILQVILPEQTETQEETIYTQKEIPLIEKVKKTKNCKKCKHKLLAVTCKCKETFCVKHLSLHDCKFDYHSENKQQLTKDNPIVKGEKIRKI